MSEKGPVYNVELIDVLPCNRGSEDGMKQAMPSRLDLLMALNRCPSERVAAGYEVLLNHWRDAEAEVERLQAFVAKLRKAIESLPCVCVSDMPCYRCVVLVETLEG